MLTDGSYRLLTSMTVETVVGETLSLARRVIPADAYAVWRRDGEEWHVAGSHGLGPEFAAIRLAADPTSVPFEQPLLAVDPEHIEQLSDRLPAYRIEGIRSLVSIPLAVRGEPSGSVVFYYRTRHQPSAVELRVAVALGHLAAAAVSNVELYQDAQRANRVKDEFLATLSHELRTPLNVIAGRARMLTAATELEQARPSIAAIDRNCQTLVCLVDDLLDVSRMTIGQVRLNLEVVDLGAVVTAATQSVQSLADAKRLALVTELAGDVLVLGDSVRLQQIAWNLLTNAIKFSRTESRIVIAARADGNAVLLAVRDSGRGIAADALPHVFDMFWQAEPLSGRRQGGLGLGLSIVKTLAELHGGSIAAESAGLNQGATFTVRLPRADTRSAAARPPV
jgi:signal transduction histidine kinase